MLDKKAALDCAAKRVAEEAPPGQTWSIAENHTMEIASAWIFFYNSRKYFETGNIIHKLAGNGPIFVNKETGQVQFYGSTPPLESLIEQYEKLSR
jgi:hypothetical protein